MMKTISFLKRAFFVGVAGLFLVVTLLSCGAKSKKDTTESGGDKASQSSSCLNGKWSVTADNVEKSFTFNEDKTGTEVSTPEDIRQFKWELKDDNKVAILYVGDDSNKEWTLNLDCEATTLSFFGLVFKK